MYRILGKCIDAALVNSVGHLADVFNLIPFTFQWLHGKEVKALWTAALVNQAENDNDETHGMTTMTEERWGLVDKGDQRQIDTIFNEHLGPVVRKLISANPGLNFAQGFWFSCLKALLLLITSDSLKAAKAKLLCENNLLESASLWIKSDFKNRTNPGLA